MKKGKWHLIGSAMTLDAMVDVIKEKYFYNIGNIKLRNCNGYFDILRNNGGKIYTLKNRRVIYKKGRYRFESFETEDKK
jgi:hypothetical protein